MKLSDMKTHGEVLEEDLARDPEFREEWERTASARAVSNYLVAYRVQHNLTQEELANRLGMKQSQVARWEAGVQPPSLRTLQRIALRLGVDLHLDITQSGRFTLA